MNSLPTRLGHNVGWGVLLLLLAYASYFFSPSQSGWRYEDGTNLLFALQHSPLEYFFNPDIARQQSYAHIAPWNAFFYHINSSLFKLNPIAHYWHLSLILGLCGYLTYAIISHTLGNWFGILAAILFISSPATGAVSQLLMAGNYASGLLFALIAFILFIRAIETSSTTYSILAAISYAAACLCKELYVPLPIILLFYPLETFKLRVAYSIPSGCICMLYLVWRWIVLGGVGGYAGELLPNINLIGFFKVVIEQSISSTSIAWILFSITGVLLLKRLWNIQYLMFVIAILVASLVPILAIDLKQLSWGTSLRYVFVVDFFLCLALTYVALLLSKRSLPLALLFSCLSILIFVSAQVQKIQMIQKESRDYEVLYEAVLKSPSNSAILDATFGSVNELVAMARSRMILMDESSPVIISSEEDIINYKEKANIFVLDEACECVHGNQTIVQNLVKKYRIALEAGKDKKLKLSISFRKDGRIGRVSWKLGPYEDSNYLFESTIVQVYNFPPVGRTGFLWEKMGVDWKFRIKYP